MKITLVKTLLWILPRNLISRLFGNLVSAQIPLLSPLIRDVFIKMYKLDSSESEFNLHSYPTLQKMFTRKLKPGARPLADDEFVSPVDGRLSQCGQLGLGGLRLIQAKGKTYSLEMLLGDEKLAKSFAGGTWATIYLAPYNYHRIHTPVAGRIQQAIHIPGTLWPVNEWSVEQIPDLFCINERMISIIEMPNGGTVAVVKVGATNVGRISLAYHPNMVANMGQKTVQNWFPPQKIEVQKGDELGCFELGSTVVLILDAEVSVRNPDLFQSWMNKPVQMGQSLCASL
jgi:phosphatidylserine decarboxylase